MTNKNYLKKGVTVALLSATVAGAVLPNYSYAAIAPKRDQIEDAYLLELEGILKGDEQGNLLLDEGLERRDSVLMLSRLLGEERTAGNHSYSESSPTWKDVRTDNYYLPFLAWAQENGLYEGDDLRTFNPREDISAREYSLVLLRSLGYKEESKGHDAWKNALEDARKLGLLEGVILDKNETMTRGKMSTMTVNALRTKMKGEKFTLAEKLNIVLPPSVEKPEGTIEDSTVQEVEAKNLKEVSVRFDKTLNKKDVDLDNLEIVGQKIKRFHVEGDTLILEVEGLLKQNKEYTLKVKDEKNKITSHKFKAFDNQAAEVLSVESLGNEAIIVKLSEPVKNIANKNFKLDGKHLAGSISEAGRELVIKTYGKMDNGSHTLEVMDLVDYAGFKSITKSFDFTVDEDNVKPTVVHTSVKNNVVEVEFSEPVKVERKSTYWLQGRNKNYADSVTQLDFKTYRFNFDKTPIPVHEITLVIEDVVDYSGNKLDRFEETVKPELDLIRPEVVDVEGKNDRVLKIKFSKELDKKTAEDKYNYEILKDKDGKEKVNIGTAKLVGKDTVELTLLESLNYDKEYTLRASGVKDNSYLNNLMIDYDERFKIADKSETKIKEVVFKEDKNSTTITVEFTKEVDEVSATKLSNYMVKIDNRNYSLADIDGSDIQLVGGKKVYITVDDDRHIESLVMFGIRDKDDKTIQDISKEIINDEKAAVLTKPVIIKKNDEIKLEFDKSISEAPRDAFTITYNDKDILKHVDIKGRSIVIGTEEFGSDAKVVIKIDETKIIGANGMAIGKDKEVQVEVKDELKPTVNTKLTGVLKEEDKVELTVEFDEEIVVKDTAKENIQIKSQLRKANISKDKIVSVVAEGNKLTVVIDVSEDVKKIKDDGLEANPINVYELVKLTGIEDGAGNTAALSKTANQNETLAIKVIK